VELLECDLWEREGDKIHVWSVHDGPFEALRIDAKDEVMTTLLTEGAFFLIAFKIPVVPMTAGSMRSFWVSVTLIKPPESASSNWQLKKQSSGLYQCT
jgi:hypothetical protein